MRIQHNRWRRCKRKLRRRRRQYLAGEIDEDRYTQSVISLVGHLQYGDTYRLRKAFFRVFEG